MALLPVEIFQGQTSNVDSDYQDNLPVNMYQIPKPIGTSKGYLRSQWGLELLATAPGIDQGGIWSSVFGNHFRVSDGNLITVSSQGVVDNIGSIGYKGHCILNQTERNIAVTTNSGCWLYNPNDGLRKISDQDLGAVFDTVYINQRLIHTDGEFIIVSNPGNDEEYDALKYGTAEIDPDGIIGLASISNRLLAIGGITIEWFADAPQDGDSFPYIRIESQLIESGCAGTHAKVMMNDSSGFKTVYMLGGGKNDPVAVRSIGAGNSPKVSTKEIDQVLQSYTAQELSIAVLENRTIEASNFVIVHLRNHTLMMDLAASEVFGAPMWTIQKSAVEGFESARWTNGVFDPRISSFVYGDKINGSIGKLRKEINTQYGDVMEEIFYTPIIPFSLNTVSELSIDSVPGRNEPNTEPVLFLSSTTNDLIYSPEYLISRGSQGSYEYNITVRVRDFFRRPASYKFRGQNKQPINVSNLVLEVI